MYSIIDSAKQGNRDALEQIYYMYNKQIYYFCSKLITDSDLAKNFTYETFSCAFERISTLEEADQLELWIKNIAAIKCYNYIHKMKPMLFLHSAEENDEPLFLEEEIEKFEEGQLDETLSCSIMDKMLDRLDDAQRMTIMFHYFNALSISQIAKIMSCTEDMVRQRLKISASKMKKTLISLAEKGTKLAKIDFRTVISLMAACRVVPEDLENRILGHIAEISISEEAPVKEEKDYSDDYSFDNYVSSLERTEPGELEAAISRFTSYIEREETKKKEKEAEKLLNNLNEEKAPRKIEKSDIKVASASALVKFLTWFKGLGVTKQSICLIGVAGFIAIIIILISALSGNEAPKKENTSANKTSSVVSQVVSQKEEPKAVYKMTFEDNEELLKAQDGTILAKASYKLPKVEISLYEDAQNAINKYFANQMAEILSTYKSQEKIAECNYMYDNQHYGPFKVNETLVETKVGRVHEKIISVEIDKYSYIYGNVHGQDEKTAVNFDTKTGEILNLDAVMSDKSGYEDYATNFICKALETNQANGEYTIYSDYNSVVRTTVTKDGRWLFTDKGLTIIFNVDEVAYFSAGVQTFTIPYAELDAFLNADYK